MRRILWSAILTLFFATAVVPNVTAQTTPLPPQCQAGKLPSGALSLICIPDVWNHELVVFAHGYVAPDLPLDFYHLDLPDGTNIPTLVMSLGYAFATTSYRRNGLAILEGVNDIRELLAVFPYPGARTHITGVSEGGLVATLLAERWPELFSSAVAACGPIGSFREQLEFIGDFRVLFDYFFPRIIPGTAIDIPEEVMRNWESIYVPRILAALAANPGNALQLMRVSRAAYDPSDPTTIARTTINLLWYSVFATRDAIARLGGNPFGNRLKWYFGSKNDLLLNLRVQRFSASPAARADLHEYETNGNLSIPLVTLHTTGDEVVPIWHELLYLPKLDLTGRGRFLPLPIFRYGHCNFTPTEVLAAFQLAVRR